MSGATRTLVALLRGVNVGRAKRVAMADLRALVAALGYGDVRTLLNSGNVVFTAPADVAPDAAAARIERALVERTGVAARVAVLTAAELAAIVAANPLADAENPSWLFVAVLRDPAARPRVAALLDHDWGPERLAVGERAAYLWCPAASTGSPLSEAVARALGDAATTRNWATTQKLHALAGG